MICGQAGWTARLSEGGHHKGRVIIIWSKLPGLSVSARLSNSCEGTVYGRNEPQSSRLPSIVRVGQSDMNKVGCILDQ